MMCNSTTFLFLTFLETSITFCHSFLWGCKIGMEIEKSVIRWGYDKLLIMRSSAYTIRGRTRIRWRTCCVVICFVGFRVVTLGLLHILFLFIWKYSGLIETGLNNLRLYVTIICGCTVSLLIILSASNSFFLS